MTKEYIIYCDESLKRGRYYSNFYGGVLVRSDHLDAVCRQLEKKKEELNLGRELKWVRITENYISKYLAMVDLLFDLIEADIIKARVMFTQNRHVPINLEEEQIENRYFLLYYQFLKHSFGLQYSNGTSHPIHVRVYPDFIPHTKEKTEQFKSFIANLAFNHAFRAARVVIRREDITEIDSSQHVLAQCVDIILGAMQFRLNDMHKEKPEGARLRGKRTRAKEKVYNHIRQRIQAIYPNFNVGVSTGTQGSRANRWHHPYRHWQFIPSEYEIDNEKTKRRGK